VLDLLNLPGVEPADLRCEEGVITVVANAVDGSPPKCPECARPMYRHGKRTSIFADTPLQMQPTRLEIVRPRYRCDACGKMMLPELSFVDERRRATRRLVDAIRERCLSTTFHSMAQQTGLAVNTIKNIAHDLIEELERTVRYETPVIMGIDEVNLAGGYRCVITNLATNNVFDMLEERTQEHLKPYFEKLPDRERVNGSVPICGAHSRSRLVPTCLMPDSSSTNSMSWRRHPMRWTRSAKIPVGAVEARAGVRQEVDTVLTLKRPSSLTAAEQEALQEVRNHIPELATAYDFKEAFYRIYDDPDKGSAMRAFEAWENVLPTKGMEGFKALAKTVHNHYEDIFAYWDSPVQITNAYTESLNGLIKIANRLGRGYSYEIIRAKTLYAKYARKVGSGVRLDAAGKTAIPTTGTTLQVEYGPHIPTLVEIAESGGLD